MVFVYQSAHKGRGVGAARNGGPSFFCELLAVFVSCSLSCVARITHRHRSHVSDKARHPRETVRTISLHGWASKHPTKSYTATLRVWQGKIMISFK